MESFDVLVQTGTYHLRACSVSEMDNNVYLLTCRSSGAQAVVDAADDVDTIERLVAAGTGSLDLVVTTHQHWDHHRALADLCERYAVRTAAGAEDAAALPVHPDVLVHDGDVLTVGELRLEVIGLRGHTPGSVALALRAPDSPTVLLTGDSLFPGGPGRTTSPQDFTSLMDDLEARVFAVFPDDTVVLPGHGAGTTLGAERPHLAQWRERGW
ncbi:MBL fold metallo-hydrolase [Ornithinimicrobium sediminis]|uniref:MBL fold metallo-hydrolase n=1 Tax=Ornithinimicrobium sediminis TaxID=2904603 RepID=UPI001E6313D6|nr:MBL fold metallo-hydrolase [Ornithinimicrobium sediminis]MCE0487590.1 MBL fold metallo-hydrolase [Ornithinimicrobium sediminis]